MSVCVLLPSRSPPGGQHPAGGLYCRRSRDRAGYEIHLIFPDLFGVWWSASVPATTSGLLGCFGLAEPVLLADFEVLGRLFQLGEAGVEVCQQLGIFLPDSGTDDALEVGLVWLYQPDFGIGRLDQAVANDRGIGEDRVDLAVLDGGDEGGLRIHEFHVAAAKRLDPLAVDRTGLCTDDFALDVFLRTTPLGRFGSDRKVAPGGRRNRQVLP